MKLYEYVTHKNWGGKFQIVDVYPSSFTVVVVTEPNDWHFMLNIGWEGTMTFDTEDSVYFLPIKNKAFNYAPESHRETRMK